MFDFEIVIEFGLVLGREWAGLLPFKEFPHALAGRLRGLEVNDFTRTERGDELNQFFVWFHAGSFASGSQPDKLVASPEEHIAMYLLTFVGFQTRPGRPIYR
jgi:hypothetical protein